MDKWIVGGTSQRSVVVCGLKKFRVRGLRFRIGLSGSYVTNGRSGLLAKDGWTGGVGFDHGVGREQCPAVFVEV